MYLALYICIYVYLRLLRLFLSLSLIYTYAGVYNDPSEDARSLEGLALLSPVSFRDAFRVSAAVVVRKTATTVSKATIVQL